VIAFVVLDLVFHYLVKRSAGKNVSEMTYFASVGRKTLTESIVHCLQAMRFNNQYLLSPSYSTPATGQL